MSSISNNHTNIRKYNTAQNGLNAPLRRYTGTRQIQTNQTTNTSQQQAIQQQKADQYANLTSTGQNVGGILGSIVSTLSGIFDSNGINNTDTNNNDQKLETAIEKQFGQGFEIPTGYTAELDSSGNLVVKDKNGKTLNSSELQELKMHNDASIEGEDEIDAFFEYGDKDKNGTLSTDECQAFIESSLSQQGIDINDSVKEHIKESMKLINSDGNEQITRDELRQNLETAMAALQEKLGADKEE